MGKCDVCGEKTSEHLVDVLDKFSQVPGLEELLINKGVQYMDTICYDGLVSRLVAEAKNWLKINL